MERLRLDLPRGARASLRRLASATGTTESDCARTLLLDALRHAQRRAHLDQAVRASSPERRTRDLEILRALERAR